MEKALKKFIKKMLSEKFPMYLDVNVRPYIEGSLKTDNPFNRKRYEVILVIHKKDLRDDYYSEVGDYVIGIAKYMEAEVMGLYHQVVDDEEWEKMKSNKKD